MTDSERLERIGKLQDAIIEGRIDQSTYQQLKADLATGGERGSTEIFSYPKPSESVLEPVFGLPTRRRFASAEDVTRKKTITAKFLVALLVMAFSGMPFTLIVYLIITVRSIVSEHKPGEFVAAVALLATVVAGSTAWNRMREKMSLGFSQSACLLAIGMVSWAYVGSHNLPRQASEKFLEAQKKIESKLRAGAAKFVDGEKPTLVFALRNESECTIRSLALRVSATSQGVKLYRTPFGHTFRYPDINLGPGASAAVEVPITTSPDENAKLRSASAVELTLDRVDVLKAITDGNEFDFELVTSKPVAAPVENPSTPPPHLNGQNELAASTPPPRGTGQNDIKEFLGLVSDASKAIKDVREAMTSTTVPPPAAQAHTQPRLRTADVFIKSVSVTTTRGDGGAWDESGPPDPKVKLTSRTSGADFTTPVKRDSDYADFNVKSIRVAEGDTIEVVVFDADVFMDDVIGTYVKLITAETLDQKFVNWSFGGVLSLQLEFQP